MRPPVGAASGIGGSLDAEHMLDVIEMTKVG